MYNVFFKKYGAEYRYGDDKNNLQMRLIADHCIVPAVSHAATIDEAMKELWKYEKFEGNWKNQIKYFNGNIVQYYRIEWRDGKPLTKYREERWKAGKTEWFFVLLVRYDIFIEEHHTISSNEIKSIADK